jgi:beta-glucosidase
VTDHPFPAGFLFGASTAAHQIEGGNVNSNWWAYEHAAGTHVAAPSGDAADSFHRWPDDLDLVASLGFNAYRFSIEWARIEPEPGEFSRAALAHYRRMIDGCLARGVEPIVTLHHFTDPRWFARAGGWRADDAADRFAAYVRRAATILDGVTWVCTINEPNILTVQGRLFAAGDADAAAEAERDVPTAPLPAPHRATERGVIAGHHAARAVLREERPGVQVGWTIASQVVSALPGGEAAADAFRDQIEDVYLRESVDDDWVGVQSYTRNRFGPDGFVRDDPVETHTLTGWEYWPDAVGDAVRHTADVLPHVPILITENGIATAEDDRRIAYTDGALRALRAAMDDGVDVRGYLHWSLLDNYEWGSFEPTFGLIAWNPETFDRTPQPSATWLGQIASAIPPAAPA